MLKTFSWGRVLFLLAWATFVGGAATRGFAAEVEGEAEPAPKIEIRGVGGEGFGGGFSIGLPKEFEEMMKSAQEVQALQSKYDSSIADLIAAAKGLEKSENLMDSVTKVAKLAKQAEELKAEITKRNEDLAKKFGGGGAIVSGFGISGGVIGGDAKILPIAPKIEFKIDGVEIETPSEDKKPDAPKE